MYRCPATLRDAMGMDFTPGEIEDARDNGRLLTVDLELSRRCNFKCLYCYSSAGQALPSELSKVDPIVKTNF